MNEKYKNAAFTGKGLFKIIDNKTEKQISFIVMDVKKPPFIRSNDPRFLFAPGYSFFPEIEVKK